MMKKGKRATAVCSLILCALLCGCGESRGQEILMIGSGSGEAYDAGQKTEDSGETSLSAAADTGGSRKEDGNQGEASASVPVVPEIRVHVCGAVNNPGVVSLPEGSIAEEALFLAGGFTEEASRDYVNLAERLKDGEQLYFPTVEEVVEGPPPRQEAGDDLININTADVAALCTLPGIGESRARDIIAYREANGSFESCEDIMKVPGIKTSVYSKISDRIKVN